MTGREIAISTISDRQRNDRGLNKAGSEHGNY